MKELCIIVAVDAAMGIGSNGDMLFHIKDDLRRFKEITMGCPVVMGRKTFESLPKGALPGRRNIVVTRNAAYTAPGIETATSLAKAIEMGAEAERVFVIGGGQIYAEAMPIAHRLYITRIDALGAKPDTFFPDIDTSVWHAEKVSESFTDPRTGALYRFEDYIKTI